MNVELSGPNKSGYKFSEVTSLTGVKPYVLRFWETEFEHIRPETNELGQKVYSPKDVETIHKVKKLLFDDKLTIPQAKGYLDRDIIDFEEPEECDEPAAFDGEVPEFSFTDEEDRLTLRSQQLKAALDAIIEKNSAPAVPEIMNKANEAVIAVKKELVASKLTDKDIVNLVSAKKKLNIVLSRIDQLFEAKGWH